MEEKGPGIDHGLLVQEKIVTALCPTPLVISVLRLDAKFWVAGPLTIQKNVGTDPSAEIEERCFSRTWKTSSVLSSKYQQLAQRTEVHTQKPALNYSWILKLSPVL